MAIPPVPTYAEVSFSQTDKKTGLTKHEFNPVWLQWFLSLSAFTTATSNAANPGGTSGQVQFNNGGLFGGITPATGYGTPTGGSAQGSFAAGAITLPQLAAAVAQLIIDLKAAGLLTT